MQNGWSQKQLIRALVLSRTYRLSSTNDATAMQVDPDRHWSAKPFATRLVDIESTDRVTLTADRLRVTRDDGSQTDRTVPRAHWDATLGEWFAMERPGPWPDTR